MTRALDECIYPLPDEVFEKETTYSNQAVSFRIRPGCETIENIVEDADVPGQLSTEFLQQIAETPRNLSLAFRVRSGVSPRRLAVAHIPTHLFIPPGTDTLYLVDSGLNRVLSFDASTLQQGVTID